jgi:hypothetical protein
MYAGLLLMHAGYYLLVLVCMILCMQVYTMSTVYGMMLCITSKSIRLDDNINTDYNLHGIQYY